MKLQLLLYITAIKGKKEMMSGQHYRNYFTPNSEMCTYVIARNKGNHGKRLVHIASPTSFSYKNYFKIASTI